MKLLSVKDLEVRFPAGKDQWGRAQFVHAVRGVSLELERGETVGVVGESGCGKSSFGKSLVLLNRPSSGTIEFKGQDLLDLKPAERRVYRRAVQMVFQDPYGSLNPKLTIGASICEGLEVHQLCSTRSERDARVGLLLERVGLEASAAQRYPREFSGGQRQRIGIARALAVEPELIVCDEPVSALDVSVQAQIVNLFRDLQKETDISYLFISHDLAVVEHLSHRIVVMYLGEVVEEGTAAEVVNRPRHPYTQALVAAVPGRGKQRDSIPILPGEVPSPLNPPSGCAFQSRCPVAEDLCRTRKPVLTGVDPLHRVACHKVVAAQSD